MAVLYLDEDVPIALADLLRPDGHTITTTRDTGRYGTNDPAQLLYATQHGATIITGNGRHFWFLHEAWHTWPMPFPHGGIVALAGGRGRLPAAYASDIRALLARPGIVLVNAHWFWGRQAGWRDTFEK